MTYCQRVSAIVSSIVFVCATSLAAQDPVIYTDNRTTSSTFRDRGTSYAPTYLIYVDKQRTADDAKQLLGELGMAPHLDEYKARAFVVGPSNGIAYEPADLTALHNLLRTRRSSNLKVIGVGAGATFVNNVISTYAFAVAGILTYGGTVDKAVVSSIRTPIRCRALRCVLSSPAATADRLADRTVCSRSSTRIPTAWLRWWRSQRTRTGWCPCGH